MNDALLSDGSEEKYPDGLPFKPKDWVSSNLDQDIAQVKAVHFSDGEVLLDLVLYDTIGNKIGRESPAMGGPRTFEPCCSADDWERIEEPAFPLSPKWVKGSDGKTTMRYWAGGRLPPANWKKKPRKPEGLKVTENYDLRRALQSIADGHNDPRTLAQDVLSKLKK